MKAPLAATALLLAVQTPAQPNILFFCMDDLKTDLGCYGADLPTPNIDRLARSGTLFVHHYVQQAVCGPSRASMFSGLRPDTTKVWDLQHTCREECPQAFTMQEYFKKNGYQTAGSGKIMHGFKDDDPPSWSIPYLDPALLPYAGGKVPAHHQQYQGEAIHAAYAKLQASGIKKYKEQQEFMASLGAKPSTECLDLPDDAYEDGALAVWGTQMLDRFAQEGKPFFLTLGFNRPHLPFVAPRKYWDLFDRSTIELAAFREQAQDSPSYAYHNGGELRGYSDLSRQGDIPEEKQRELIHGYRACIAYVDAQIGKVLDKLAETGLDKNTIIVLWGDHGWHLGDHNIWCKHSTFEQATRSPLIIAAPQAGKPGNCRAPVESVDIFPTLCELAGLEIPAQLEGASLVPILQNPKAKVKEFALSQYPDHGRKGLMGYALRTERYRLVVWVPEAVSQGAAFDAKAIDSLQLYDYEKDPLETANLAGHPEYKPVMEGFEQILMHKGIAGAGRGK